MSNAVKGLIEAPLEDGRVIKLLFDFNTWVDAEEATGLELQDLLDGLKSRTLSAKHQRALFWCAMREYQPEITEREAGKLLVELAGALERAMKAGMPKEEDEQAEVGDDADADPLPAVAGTGTSS